MPPNVYDHNTPADIQDDAAVLTSEKPVSTDLSEVESEHTVDDESNDSDHDSDPSSDRSDESRSKEKDVIYVGSADSSVTILSSLRSSGSISDSEVPDNQEDTKASSSNPTHSHSSDDKSSESAAISTSSSNQVSASSSSEESETSNPEKTLTGDEFNPHGFYSDDPELQDMIDTELREWWDFPEEDKKALFDAAKGITIGKVLDLSDDFNEYTLGLLTYHGMNLLHQATIKAIEVKEKIEKIESPKERAENFQILYDYCHRFLGNFFGMASRDICPLPWNVRVLEDPKFEYNNVYIGKTVVELMEENFKNTLLEGYFENLIAKELRRKNDFLLQGILNREREEEVSDLDLDDDSRAEGFFRSAPRDEHEAQQNNFCTIL